MTMHSLVVMPTFDEIDCLPDVLDELTRVLPEVQVLVVDDSSPDGTGEWASARAATDPRVHVLHRPRKSGLASAYVDGFGWGAARGFDVLIEMDADGSHRPRDLAKLLARLEGPDHPDLVIGSRWVFGGGVRGWSLPRQLLSRMGNVFIRGCLAMEVHDATAGFRAYRRDFLVRSAILTDVDSTGYGFQVEMTWAALRAGATVVEVPITFLERRAGVSKLSADIFWEELRLVTRRGLERVLGGGPQPLR